MTMRGRARTATGRAGKPLTTRGSAAASPPASGKPGTRGRPDEGKRSRNGIPSGAQRQRHREVVWADTACSTKSRFDVEKGQRPCPCRRERRRQIDACQDHHRDPRGRCRRNPSQRQASALRDADRGPAAGVAAVYQDPKLFPHLDVAENIFMGAYPATASAWSTARRCTRAGRAALAGLGVDIDPRALIAGSRSPSCNSSRSPAHCPPTCSILILDEPTSALTPAESEQLFRIVRGCSSEGKLDHPDHPPP